MESLLLTILGGFLAAVVYASTISSWNHVRRPIYVPHQNKEWPDDFKEWFSRAGYTVEGVTLIGDRHVEFHRVKGYSIVRLGFWRRTIRSVEEPNLILMTCPTAR
jgi:hypothetical protein